MKKFFIYYANGYFESTSSINVTLVHMIELGLIKVIIDTEANEAYIKNEEGGHKRVKIPNVEGLS